MIFWEYTKGFNNTNTAIISGKTPGPLWSFLHYLADPNIADDWNTDNKILTFSRVPTISISRTNTDDNAHVEKSFGHIITQNAYGQSIAQAFSFLSTLSVTSDTTVGGDFTLSTNKKLYFNGSTATTYITYTGSWLTFCSAKGIYFTADDGSIMFEVDASPHKFTFSSGEDTTDWCEIAKTSLTMRGSISASGTSSNITSGGYMSSGSSVSATTYVNAGTYVQATTYCQAQYFNATSDRRAKTDIQPLLIDALDLVRKTKLYSFKYKETDTPSIGIIAQDVQDVDINGFKLVDNEEATGKDLDYMTIHESKLTYILWKAVQEQQKLIEDLQKEIKELKKN